MPIVNLGQMQPSTLDVPWPFHEEKTGTNQFLALTRGDRTEPLAARHISNGVLGWTKPNRMQDVLVVTVATCNQSPFDVFVEEKHYRRPATRPGAIAVSDFRLSGYANLSGLQVDNTAIYLPVRSIDALADDLRVPRVSSFKSCYDEDYVDPAILNLVNIMKLALERPEETNQFFLGHVLAAVTAHVAFNYGSMERPKKQLRGSLTGLQERRIRSQLLEQLADPPSLQELASSCGLSLSHFARAFKETTGLPPHRWLLAERVKRAKHLLRETQAPITQIALECGFADQSHMTRVFTKAASLSPAAWRRQGRC